MSPAVASHVTQRRKRGEDSDGNSEKDEDGVSSISGKIERLLFHRVISVLRDALRDVGTSKIASTVFVCLKELYLVLYRFASVIEQGN
ncbi:hypothetical protein ACS0TY_032626 [Phlomoides rotata]